MINIHPSLLPALPRPPHARRALAAGVRSMAARCISSVPELDAGPIIAQAAVPVLPGDTAETLAARVLVQEHMLYPQALRMICDGTRPAGERPGGVFARLGRERHYCIRQD